jgi:hypothetical protein
MEHTDAVWMFHCTCFFISFSSRLIRFRPRIMVSGQVLQPTNRGGVSLCTESAERSPLSVPIGCGTHGFVRLRLEDDCFIPCFLSFISLIYWLWQPRRSGPREGDNVTATHNPRPGKHHYM